MSGASKWALKKGLIVKNPAALVYNRPSAPEDRNEAKAQSCATLLLRAGVPVHVVSERLGHKGIEITPNIYAHVLPDQQEDAARTIGSLLHG